MKDSRGGGLYVISSVLFNYEVTEQKKIAPS